MKSPRFLSICLFAVACVFILPSLKGQISPFGNSSDSGGNNSQGNSQNNQDNQNNKDDQNNNPQSKAKDGVKLLNGNFLFGTVELKDDYTLKITSDSGIANVAIAMLDQAGFKKYGFQKDRSEDGKFWSDRKNALEDTQNSDANKNASGDTAENGDKPTRNLSNPEFEISFKELAPFQALIQSYESALNITKYTNGNQNGANGSNGLGNQNGGTSGVSSLPGSPLGNLTQPVNTAVQAVQPIISAGASMLGAGGGLPSAGLPSAPVSPPTAPTAP